MIRWAIAAAAFGLLLGRSAAKPLQIYFIDVEGGESTLVVTPAGESMLIDAGYAGRDGRDPGRIMAAAHDAGLQRIDDLLITHFHPDHVGGVPELSTLIPIGAFIDYGQPLGTDRMTTTAFSNYAPVRNRHPHLQLTPGDRLPLEGVDAVIVSAGGTVLARPLRGAGQKNDACVMLEDQPEDGTENYRSLGLRLEYGRFRFTDLGDLSGNTLTSLACPRDLLGETSLYLVAHHGNYDSDVPAVVAALRPRVAIMNNGVRKGGDPEAFDTLRRQPGLDDLWQLHASTRAAAGNSQEDLIANLDQGQSGYWLKVTAESDGRFTVVNERNGFSKAYSGDHKAAAGR